MIFNVIVICTLIVHHVFCGDPHEQMTDEERQQISTHEKFERDAETFKKYTEDLIQDTMSCEEFLANYTFDVSKIIDVDWRAFYYWTNGFEEGFDVKFSLATKLIVDRYKVELDGTLKKPVAWEDALLFMEVSDDFSVLVLKTKTEGLFKMMPSLMFNHADIPILTFAIKYVEPCGYLALINCKFRTGYALAPIDKLPELGKSAEEALKIGYSSKHGKSFLDLPFDVDVPQAEDRPESHDDDNEDMHFEYERQMNEERYSILM